MDLLLLLFFLYLWRPNYVIPVIVFLAICQASPVLRNMILAIVMINALSKFGE